MKRMLTFSLVFLLSFTYTVILNDIISKVSNVDSEPTVEQVEVSATIEVIPVSTPVSEPTVESVVSEEPVEEEPLFQLSEYQRSVVECMVMGEAGGEPYEGQVMVAHCILSACLKEDLQPSEVRINYKYSGWNEHPSESVKEAVTAVFDRGEFIVDDTPLFFYAPKWCNSKWHETQRYICTIGGHKFFGEWS